MPGQLHSFLSWKLLFFIAMLLTFGVSGLRVDLQKPGLNTTRAGPQEMLFEANRGQSDSRVKFISRGPGYTLFLTSTGAVMRLSRPPADASSLELRLKLSGMKSHPRVVGLSELTGRANYFLGNDPKKWHVDIPVYTRIQYEDVYPGVDLFFYGNKQQLEYDFVVAAGADPTTIALTIESLQELHIDAGGNLVVGEDEEGILFQKPVVYQQIDGIRRDVQARYGLKGINEVGFIIGEYDRTKSLTIDPVFIYSSYLGGSGLENASSGSEVKRADIVADAEGNTYVTGTTDSVDFPVANALQSAPAGLNCAGVTSTPPQTIFAAPCPDAFIMKLSPTGSLLYSTYLGGGRLERGFGIAVDASGAVYVAGRTQSEDFPTVNALRSTARGEDAFVTKLNETGSVLVYSTYFGGSGSDDAVSIAVDSAGNACIAGETQSSDLPLKNPFQSTLGGTYDAYIAKINAAGSEVVYASYLGGAAEDDAEDVIVDPAGNAYVVGITRSTNFPARTSLQGSLRGESDAFIAKFTATGSMDYSTYLGGSSIDGATAVALGPDGLLHVTGVTFSTDFPAAPAPTLGHQGGIDAFVTKLDATGSSLIYSMYVSGSLEDIPYGIAVDSTGNTYVAGTTTSLDFPITNALQESRNGNRDAFLVKVNVSGTQYEYATYWGGSDLDWAYGIALDTAGNAYLTGITTSEDWQTAFPFQATRRGPNRDAFVMKIAASVPNFTIPDRRVTSWMALGDPKSTTVGYARIQPDPGKTTPGGLAIFGLRQNNVLVSEASVPASAPMQSGRIYAQVNGPVTTGLAIANPNSAPATVSFFFTDENGHDFGHGNTVICAQCQIARFLNESPFSGGSSISGTFTFNSSHPISAIALRGITNERLEFLITTLPVSPISVPSGNVIFPQFADGGGWSSEIILINPTDAPLNGVLEFFGQQSASTPGQPITLTVDGQTGQRFNWSIAPRGSKVMRTAGSQMGPQVGWVLTTPSASSNAPFGLVVISYKKRGMTVAEAGVANIKTATAFRMYAEAAGNTDAGQAGFIQTGVAVANPSADPVKVTFELTTQSGANTVQDGTILLPARGHLALFLNQISGFESLRLPARGMLRISSSSGSAISVIGLRGRYNERGDFLITTITPMDESLPAPVTEFLFPHFVSGAGYSTQFILFGTLDGQVSSGSVRFLSQSGKVIQ